MDQWSEWSSVTYHRVSWCCKNSTYFLDSLNYIGAITTPFQQIPKAISEMQRHWSETLERWTAPLSEQPAESGTRLLKIPSCLQQQNMEPMNFYERSFGYYSNVWNTVKFARSEFLAKPANPVQVLVPGPGDLFQVLGGSTAPVILSLFPLLKLTHKMSSYRTV